MASASLRLVARPVVQPLGAKLQVIAHLDPAWLKALESVVNWKLSQLERLKAG